MKPLYLIIHYFFIFVKLKARFSRYEQDLQDLQDMSRISFRLNRRARACPSPPSVSPKASRPGGLSYRRSISLTNVGRGPVSRRRGDRGGQAPALRCVDVFLMSVGRGPVPRHRGDRGGQAPALRGRSISLYTAGRGPVPRQRRNHRKPPRSGAAASPLLP